MPPTTTKYPFEPDNYPTDTRKQVYGADEEYEGTGTETSGTGHSVTVKVDRDEQLARIESMVSDNENRIQNISINIQFQTFILIVLLIILIFKI